jgi:hypothetical protein
MQACSQVAAMDMLLWGALAMVGRDILHPIRVSFEKGNSLLEFLRDLLYSLASTSIAPSPGHCSHARAMGGGDSGAGGCRDYGGRS